MSFQSLFLGLTESCSACSGSKPYLAIVSNCGIVLFVSWLMERRKF